jgi:membrane associated rhomboid family serine protease
MPQTCYRHPGRETGVSCSNCGRAICPECMTSTPVGMRCPECAGERTRVRSGVAGLQAGNEPWATYVLIALNAIVFLGELASGASATTIGGGSSLIADGAVFGPGIDDGEWYRILTGGFLHAGLLHLGLNMFVLWILGRLLEPAIGTPRFLGIYFVSLLAGSFGALVVDPNVPTVGASGAIYGLMAATIVIARRRGLEQIASEIGLWLVLNLVLTFSISGISIGGHIGGLIGGGLAGMVIAAAETRAGARSGIGIEALALLVLAVASVGGALLAAQPGGVL